MVIVLANAWLYLLVIVVLFGGCVWLCLLVMEFTIGSSNGSGGSSRRCGGYDKDY